ncbi:MAG: DUF177 domain-containing protein [Deltaproteobacteria bacterium]|nr:DUF177 domain-containing protein [Deltaproteobacteria bacterium]
MAAPSRIGHPEVYDLKKLPPDGEVLDGPIAAAWLDEQLNEGQTDEELALVAMGDGELKLELAWVDPKAQRLTLRMKGHAKATLGTHCVRCLADVKLPVEVDLDATLLPEEAIDDAIETEPGEVALAPDDLDEATYKDMQIDLPRILREAILLDLDMNPSCEDVDACEARTSALIASAVPSPEPEVDPRWAPLLALKNKAE